MHPDAHLNAARVEPDDSGMEDEGYPVSNKRPGFPGFGCPEVVYKSPRAEEHVEEVELHVSEEHGRI